MELNKLTFTFIMFLLTAAAIGTLQPLTNSITDWRSDGTTETDSCTTGVGETACNITLDDAHLFEDVTALTVSETSPGSATRTATLAEDKTTLTITGLTASTAYAFSVTYLKRAESFANYRLLVALLGQVPNMTVLFVIVIASLAVLLTWIPNTE